MAFLENRLVVKPTQRTTITPGLVQMVNLLALNKVELVDMIAEELAENPVLEEARATLARMNDQDPDLPDLSQQDLESAYRAKVGEQTVPRERLAAMGPATNLGAFDVGAEIAGLDLRARHPHPAILFVARRRHFLLRHLIAINHEDLGEAGDRVNAGGGNDNDFRRWIGD